jgi:hypothetical protein
MPFKTVKQEKMMWATHPKIARKWSDKYGSLLKKKDKKK